MNIKRIILFVIVSLLSILLIMPATAQQIVTPFHVGQTLLQNVNGDQMSRQYQIGGLPNDSLFLLALSQDYSNSPTISLTDNASNRTVAMMQMAISGMCLRIAPGTGSYTLSVTNQNPPTTQIYGLMLMQDSPTAFSCNEAAMGSLESAVSGASAASTTLIDASFFENEGTAGDNGSIGGDIDGGCAATSVSTAQGIEVHALDSVNAPVIQIVGTGETVPVLGAVDGSAWLLIDNGGVLGFAPASSVTIGGECANVPLITINGNTVRGTGEFLNIGVGTNLLSDGSDDADAEGIIRLDEDGLSVDVDGNSGVLNNGAGALLNIDVNEEGVNADINESSLNNESIEVDVNTSGNQPLIEVHAPPVNTHGQVGGSGTCINLLGVTVAC